MVRQLLSVGGLMLLSVACGRQEPQPSSASGRAALVASGPKLAESMPSAPATAESAPAEPEVTETAIDEASAQIDSTDENSLKAALLGLNRKDETTDPEPPPPRRTYRRPAIIDDVVEEPEVRDLSDAAFQDAVNSWRGMRTCLARSTLRGTDRNGAMKVAFKIRNDGSVSNCEVVETSNSVAETIAPCVERSARRIRFPAFNGDEVEKQAKFVF
ncbi:MAG: AgmX/PglI C-terminal domain-containing protein [Myxococcota bacterium]